MSGPTKGATERTSRTWQASPFWARTLGVLIFVVPLIGAWALVRLCSSLLFRPPGIAGVLIWVIQAGTIATVSAAVLERIARRLVPLQALLGMTLTFPDHAPSRFGVALRSGSIKRLQEQLDDNFLDAPSLQDSATRAIELVTLLGKHERLTRGHTERVRAYSDMVAVELGLSVVDRNKLAWAALLHDIGKLTVPPEILNKQTGPNAEEWKILANHPAAGIEILEPLRGWLGDWLLAAGEHHERFDGLGYPAGLSGMDISLAGRIVAVADAYDVITSKRSYKEPMSVEAARQELVHCSGTQFDPAIVRALLNASRAERLSGARWAWLLELPGIAQISSGLAHGATVTAVGAATVVGLASPYAPVGPNQPEEVAFSEATELEVLNTPSFTLVPEFVPPTIDPTATSLADIAPDPTSPSNNLATSSTDASTATSVAAGTPGTPSTTTAPASVTPTTSARTTPPTTAAPTTTAPTTAAPTTTVPVTTTTTAPPALSACEQLLAGASDLSGADLSGCSARNGSFANLNMSGANLDGADFRGSTFSNFSMEGASATDIRLGGATFTDGSMKAVDGLRIDANGARFTRVDLSGLNSFEADFSEAIFDNSNISGAFLSQADFAETRFINGNLTSTVLTGADLEAARLQNAIVHDASFNGADLSEANFTGASGVPRESNAIYEFTKCPNGVRQDSTCWP